ncbi:phage portal protein [Plantactinospora sp. S1510]|uniref:Phage portal protein n=1 Tax=Plantactinospora alkalitolerans TaxID=2789879 RepID=A0ABS0HAS7_9ACTN|nr:phage portal protein [Plantactinospora alkalitolerans]MBF9135308.1 phage portal protein [Plantactinospora alkalitolerans]
MPIDVEVRESPGWWLRRLFFQLNDPPRRRRLAQLHNYYIGHPPLPEGAENVREAYAAFQEHCRSNFSKLIVSATSSRMRPVGFQTAVDADVTGDAEAAAMWDRAGMAVVAPDTHNKMLALSESYVIVGDVDEETGAPLITAEDPRTMVGEPDPTQPTRLRAALKVLHDDVAEEDRAYLFLPGQVFVAYRQQKTQAWANRLPGAPDRPDTSLGVYFDPRGWDWHPDKGGADGQRLPHNRMPAVRFLNEDGLGEYEPHRNLLNRINHQILQRLTIATMQAFRQRAVVGLPLQDPKTGEEIDYSDVFTMDPAALWQLPEEAKMWESQQVDLTPILSAVKDDLETLASVTSTPMHMLQPAGENQSAEGASLSREGLVFKVEDRVARTSHAWARVMSLAFLTMDQPDRADLSKLRTLWAPPERLSLAERADAASKAANDIPRRSRLIHIWGFTPTESDAMMTEWADEQLLAAQVAAATAAMNPLPEGQQQSGRPAAASPLPALPTLPTPADVLKNPLGGLPVAA